MDNGVYHIGKRKIVINDHSTKAQKDALKKLLSDSSKDKSNSNSKAKSKS